MRVCARARVCVRACVCSIQDDWRKGENLSPILFSLFLNDLEEYLINKNNNGINLSEYTHDIDLLPLLKILILLYADDTVLLANDYLSLQKSLNEFMEFCTKWL